MKTKATCPLCKRALEAAAPRAEGEPNPFPFCSKRCKLVDLGAWLDGAYRIPGEVIVDDGDGVLSQLTSRDGGDA